MSWTCCHNAYPDNNVHVAYYPYGCTQNMNKITIPRKCTIHVNCNLQSSIGKKICCAVDLQNPKPDGVCDFPETFYLREDEKTQDIKKVTVEDVSLISIILKL